MEANSLDEVRTSIDRLDKEIIKLLAKRGAFVSQAAKLKKSSAEVAAPARVEQVINKVRLLATQVGLEPKVAEATYRAMIDAFIAVEHAEFEAKSSQ